MPSYRLTYFDTEGRGEFIRLIFAYADQKYEDIRIKSEDWPARKQEMPYGKIPSLDVDGKKIYSSVVICRYLGKVLDLMPEDPYQATVCDEIVDGINDILMAGYGVMVAKKKGELEEFKKLATEFHEKLFPPVGKALEDRLQEHEWFGGNKISWADIYAASVNKGMHSNIPEIFDSYPKIKAHMEKVVASPRIQKWLKERPKDAV